MRDAARAASLALALVGCVAEDAGDDAVDTDLEPVEPLPEACGTSGTICTVAGIGSGGFNGDGLPARETQLFYPTGVAFGTSGELLIADYENSRIRRLDASGRLVTIAGNGTHGYAEPGLGALESELAHPVDMVQAPDGTLYIDEMHASRILVVRADGILRVLAGSLRAGYDGDGGPAINATLRDPSGLALDADGQLWIADSGNDALRVIRTDGTIETVLGGHLDDEAEEAALRGPQHIDIDGDRILVADTGHRRVIAVDRFTAEVTVLAGNGERAYAGDGGPALDASFTTPTSVSAAPDGTLYITDFDDHVVRRVAPDGTISTFIGDGVGLWEGDLGPSTAARAKRPIDVIVDEDGTVLVAEMVSGTVRQVAP